MAEQHIHSDQSVSNQLPTLDQAFEFNHSGQRSLFGEETGRKFLPQAPSRAPFFTEHISLFGLKTGDEGKGRSVLEISALLRFLTEDNSAVGAVVKPNGGANSGHTAAGVKLNLIPSGVADPSVPHLCIARGVLADPLKLIWETTALASVGLDPTPRLRLDNRLMVAHIGHRLLDLAGEKITPRGSTGRGITPGFCDETNQQQIFFEEFLGSKDEFVAKLTSRLKTAALRIQNEFDFTQDEWNELFAKLSDAEIKAHKDFLTKGVLKLSEFDYYAYNDHSKPFGLNYELIAEHYWQAGQKLAHLVCDVSNLTAKLAKEGKHIIYEHGQGALLDKRLGFRPSVTASHTTPAEVYHANSLPITELVYAIGVMKAYDTKVGKHLFLTQIESEHPLAEILGKIEFGTTTGRSRMVGWFDAVEAGWALKHAGAHELILNKLDVLNLQGDWQGPLKICTSYKKPDGTLVYDLPTSDAERQKLTPVYEETPGWTEEISHLRHFSQLPEAAQVYVAKLYRASVMAAFDNNIPRDALLPPLRFIGVGPNPGQVIMDVPEPGRLLTLSNC